MLKVVDIAYGMGTIGEYNSTTDIFIQTIHSGNWYDFMITSNCYPGGFVRRYMGKMETGKDTNTDPAMGIK